MKLKIRLKTILLFTALLVLGGMILGFYSCSSHNTPVAPQAIEDLPPVTTVTPDGAIIIINEDGTTTTIPPPVPVVLHDDGSETVMLDYVVTIDENGDVELVTLRQGEIEFTIDDPSGRIYELLDVDLIFSTFVETSPDVWSGTATIINDTDFDIFYPRLAWRADQLAAGKFRLASIVDVLQNPDMWCSAYIPPNQPPYLGLGMVFIADEDENYRINGGGDSATHDIVLNMPDGWTPVIVSLMMELNPEDLPAVSLIAPRVPRDILIDLDEGPAVVGSIITVTIDTEIWSSGIRGWVEYDYLGSVVGVVAQLEFRGYESGVATYQGYIQTKPSVYGATDVLVAFPGREVAGGIQDTYIQIAQFT
jgi:hypothetical protein